MYTQIITGCKTGKLTIMIWALLPVAFVVLTAGGDGGGKIARDNVYKGGRGAFVQFIISN
ncbi:MAG: hypothetical protein H6569_04820 [Lewinellaceae bacterium]|nr:hypothetical protein [Lewinellaceae bacterium]